VKFGSNIFFSAVVHATVFTAALILAGIDAASRFPEKYVTVTLLEHEAGERHAIEIAGKKEHQEIPLKVSSAPPKIISAEDPLPASEPKELAQTQASKEKETVIVASPAKAVMGEGSGPALSGQVPAGQPSTGTMHLSIPSDTLETGTSGEGSVSDRRTDPRDIDAVRVAIERAKSYPSIARNRGIEGAVIIEFTISANGNPEDIRIVKSSGSQILDSAAKKTLLRASPFPPIKGSLEVPITFRIVR
jgi:TonB family protein